jgi:hypothetical protein
MARKTSYQLLFIADESGDERVKLLKLDSNDLQRNLMNVKILMYVLLLSYLISVNSSIARCVGVIRRSMDRTSLTCFNLIRWPANY